MVNCKLSMKTNKIIRLIILFIIYNLQFAIYNSFAQNIGVSAKIDSNIILIGDHVHLSLKVNYPKNVMRSE